jgi:hypothetical protein
VPEPVRQFTNAEVKAMSPEEVVAAHRAGQLDALMGRMPAEPVLAERATAECGITPADLATMAPEAIVKARREGRLEHLGYAGDRR